MNSRDFSAARWRKSSYSNGGDSNCLEVADQFPGLLPVRDSKVPAGPVLTIPETSWSTFVAAVTERTLSP
jgi:hypothetical protein